MKRKPKIVAYTGREESEPPALAHLLLLLAGVCALLLPATDALRYSVPRTILLAASLCVFLWALARIGWHWATLGAMLCASLWCVACAMYQAKFSSQLTHAVKLLLSAQSDGRTVAFDLAAPLLGVMLALLFFSSELLIGSHVIPYSLTLAFFLLGPLIQLRPSAEAAVLAALFQFGYWAMNGSGLRQSQFDFALPSRARLTALTGGVTAAILAGILLLAVPLAMRDDERLYAPVYAAEGFVKRTVSRLTGADALSGADGRLNRGNLYPTGTPHLILTASRKPSQPVYLRGFYGSAYQSGSWEREIEREIEIYRDMAVEWNSGRDMTEEKRENLAGEIYRALEGMYWRQNYASRALRGDEPKEIDMTVRRDNLQYLNAYAPYYGAWGRNPQIPGEDADAPYVSFYELQDMDIDWENVSGSGTARWLEKHYEKYIQSLYTQVPTERVPRLAQLCRENQPEDLDDITAFILHTLHSRASYSLTPGWTPVTEDFVERFLFESGLGYCQHFASAATLMYRLYGIPARYATGYIAMPEDFISRKAIYGGSFPLEDGGADGVCTAILTDFSAHAWVEIFLTGYGWTPIEVTPAADGPLFPDYPGLNLDALAQRLAEWDFSLPATRAVYSSANAEQSLVMRFASGMSGKTRKAFVGAVAAPLLCAPVAAFAALYYRRRRRMAFYARADCRVTFGRLLSLLRFSDAIPDCDGQEADFPRRLSQAVPTIAEEEAVRLRRVAEAAAYGAASVPEEDNAFARRLYRRAADFLYGGLAFWKRPIFRWWRLYG